MDKLYRITTSQSVTTENAPKPSEVSIIHIDESTKEGEPLLGEIVKTSVSDMSIENRLNAQRMQRFRAHFSVHLLQLLQEQDFEYGIDTPADELVRKCLHENESITKQWLNQLFVENYGDQTVLIGILRVLSHFEYQEIAPEGTTMALAALANSSSEVRECGIRAFENWCTLESLEVLKNVQCHEKWLDEYLDQVIADLEEELSGNVAIGKKNR